MAYVLDSSAVIALARNEGSALKIVGEALEHHKCYVTVPTLAAVYYTLYENDGEARADHWLEYMASGSLVGVETCRDLAAIKLVAQARMIVRMPIDSAFAAALARQKDAQVITSLGSFEDLAAARFCGVTWLG